jgi:cellulose synthase (UDP-forming)
MMEKAAIWGEPDRWFSRIKALRRSLLPRIEMIPFAANLLTDAWLGIAAGGIAIASLVWLDRNNALHRTIVCSIAIFLMWRYMSWRLFSSLPEPGLTLDYFVGITFASVEMLSMLSATMSLFFLTKIRNRTPDVEANLPWLRSQAAPLIDVLICTFNESQLILEQTIVGAMSMNYSNARVWICDDGRREWLRQLCQEHGCGYITRMDNAHAKAGNINNALVYLCDLATPPEFISILDADFVPKPDFLTRSVALMRDPSIGIVQTPQHFVNADPIQGNLALSRVWPDEQRYFFDVLMASKDAWGAAFCCGTSSVIRLNPLMQIGGFPTDSVTEDYLVTLRLREIGYQTIYLNEQLSLGLAPEGIKEYITQRSRWCVGFVQICRGKSGPLRLQNGLTFVDRVILVETFLYWSATHAFRLLALIIPILFLLFGIQAVHASVQDALSYFLPCFIVQMSIMGWVTQARILPIMADVSQLIAAHNVLKAVVAGLLKPVGQKFKVTAKGGNRDVLFVEWSLLRTLLAYLVLTMVAVIWAFGFNGGWSVQESSSIALFWSWYNILILTLTCLVCIEQPRKRKAERLQSGDRVGVCWNGEISWQPVLDISTSGIRIEGRPPVGDGQSITIQMGDITLRGLVVRTTQDDFAVRIDDTMEARKAMIRQVYGSRYNASIGAVRPNQLIKAVLVRAFR